MTTNIAGCTVADAAAMFYDALSTKFEALALHLDVFLSPHDRWHDARYLHALARRRGGVVDLTLYRYETTLKRILLSLPLSPMYVPLGY